jgi:hypothetical protein
VAKVRPKKADADFRIMAHWQMVDKSEWMDKLKDRYFEDDAVELVGQSPGPVVVGLAHLQRWNLTVHPFSGLVPDDST